MYVTRSIAQDDKGSFYRELASQLRGLLEGERDAIANAANLSALIFDLVPDLNWAGFYFLKSENELVLGPFQGKVACVRIAVGKGVCGTAVAEARAMLVPDVHEFPGHIACDAASRSELVVPLIKDGRIFGVLDLDSPISGRFDAEDQAGFEALAAIYAEASDLQ
ncbi:MULTISPECIES: GAF domain-containing protein [unclassified Sinorhizobium]|uniref:GAF domain-containing protein n=1 Tax=unclassified Sinorhizobium TaxID=2613772 RepID=UPI0024C43243|nr:MULTISPECIES: GAF domain-containing protein [unclassified Sinorhizobium]MDK1374022.1 GAF domain-containing protein [Sinorhizobium sp. 6-70]MDK1477435.1 GAF domain-containing protein [Sinorhizobium sp. 6-117]